ncbi:MAG: HDOD domain-containing protein [Acidimicrobiales bacterium]
MTVQVDDLTLPSREELLVDPSKLPTPPAIVLQVIRHIGDEDNVSVAKLSEIISQDASLAASLLRLANSALYSPADRVTTLPRALMTIGLRQLRVHIMTTSMRQILPEENKGALSADEIRTRTVINGTMSRIFAEKLSPGIAEEAFLGGLLGSLGHLVLAQRAPAIYDYLVQASGGWPDQIHEMDLLGYSLDDVTGDLLGLWELPANLAEAVVLRSHHRVGWEADDVDAELVDALRLGLLAERVLTGGDAAEPLKELLDVARPLFGYDLLALSNILVEAEPVVADIAESMQFRDPTPEGGYGEQLTTARETLEADGVGA